MAAKDDDISEQIESANENLSLNELENEFLSSTPGVLPKLWQDTGKAIGLHYFKAIMQSQIDKALRGDTAAAKFITEFATPTDDSSAASINTFKWEEQVISIRNRLNLELSAEDLVLLVFTSIAAWSDTTIKERLLPTAYQVQPLSGADQ